MAQISAAQVKELREQTGAGMMDCKKALQEAGGDMEAAVDWLRTKGLAAAQKKAGRVAAEGLVAFAAGDRDGAVVEVNSETDFVARNEQFQQFAGAVAELAKDAGGDLDRLLATSYPDAGRNVSEQLTHLIATIGENMTVRRAALVSVDEGVIGSYMHAAVGTDKPNLGRIGVLVGLRSTGDAGKLAGLARQMAMHIAAAAPQSVSIDSLDPAAVEHERGILREQARESGKPAEIVEKMVDGRIRKFYQDVVLLEQTWVHDGETPVAEMLARAEKEVGAPVTVSGFARFALGEGVEKAQSDFATEVAAAAQGG